MSDQAAGGAADQSLSGVAGSGAAIGGGVAVLAIGALLVVAVVVLVVAYRKKGSAPAPTSGAGSVPAGEA